MQSTKKRVSIAWFKRDLRVHANHSIFRAATSSEYVLPLYVVEPGYWSQRDASHRHYQFLSECLSELRDDRAVGQPLIVRMGAVRNVFDQLAEFKLVKYLAMKKPAMLGRFSDRAVREWCRERGIPWTETWQNGVVRLKDRNGWSNNWKDRMTSPIAGQLKLKPLTEIDPGPIPTAKTRSLRWLHRSPTRTYRRSQNARSFLRIGASIISKMSSPVTATDTCSRISPYLAFGALSMSEVAQAAAERRSVILRESDDIGHGANLSSFEGDYIGLSLYAKN